MSENEEDRHSYTDRVVEGWESHVRLLISSVGLALMFWIGTSVVNMNTTVAVLSTKVEQIVDIKAQVTQILVTLEGMKDTDSGMRERIALAEHQLYVIMSGDNK